MAKEAVPFDQWLNTDLFNNNTLANPANPSINQFNDPLLDEINYSELFSDSNAKAQPPQSTEPELPFAPESQPDTFQGTDSFSPSVFEPATFPGSPIGALSPASEDTSSRHFDFGGSMSPVSFDLEPTTTSQPIENWTLEPSALSIDHDEEEQKPVIPETPATASSSSSSSALKRGRQSRSLSVVAEDEDGDDDNMSEADSEFHSGTSTRSSRRQSARRQTKAPKISVSKFATKELHHTSAGPHLAPVPDWMDKPDPETYSKMTPAEKRQMRNKISARNFRHRKKEQLTILEQQVADRDTIINQLRDELGTIKNENTDLKSEVALLKQKWQEMMDKMTKVATPASPTSNLGLGVKLPATPASSDEWPLASPTSEEPPVASTSSTILPALARKPRSNNTIAIPNLHKDAPPTLKRSSGSWTTQPFSAGFTSVHTTLLPDLAVPYSTQNFNPALNQLSNEQRDLLPSFTAHLQGSKPPRDDFFSSNPFSLRSSQLDQQRAQLYGKLAHNMAGLAAAQKMQQAQQADENAQLPIPNGFRPAFFSPSSALQTKTSRDSNWGRADLDERTPAQAVMDNQNALIAGYAQQTLFSRMTTAFVEAFAGTSDERKLGKMNVDKVSAVLSGKAKLQVVPNDAVAQSMDELAGKMSSVSLDSKKEPASPKQPYTLAGKWCRS